MTKIDNLMNLENGSNKSPFQPEKKDSHENEVTDKTSRVSSPPDGGWGWIVVLSSFSISLLVDGTCFSFGIFFDEFRNEFNTNKSETSWIGSVLNGSYLIFGPIISALVNMYGCKAVAMTGAVLSFVAFFLSTLSQSIGVFIFTYGFLGGIGFGLMYLPAIVMVGYYFEKRRALATGIACCGSGIGAFLFAPFTEYLLHEYGWRGATWIMSAMIFNAAFFAMFYRPLQKSDLAKPSENKTETTYREMSDANKNNKMDAEYGQLLSQEDTKINDNLLMSKEKILESLISVPTLKPEQKTRSMTLYPLPANGSQQNGFKSHVARLSYSQDFHLFQRQKLKPLTEVQKPMTRKDIFFSGSLWHLKEFREVGSLEEFHDEMKTKSAAEPSSSSPARKFLQALLNAFDTSLLRSPTFLIYGLSCFLCMAGFFVPFIYLPTHAVDLGLDSTQGAFLISIIGITNTVGRVAVGFVSDQSWADCLLINNVALIAGGVATVFVPFYPHYYLLAVYSCIFGAAIAVFVSLRSIIMVELMGIEKLTTAFGFVIMCQGMSSFVGAPIAGAISDATGNYNASFYLAGITLALSGVICLPLRRIATWESNRRSGDGSQASEKTERPWSHEFDVKEPLKDEAKPMV